MNKYYLRFITDTCSDAVEVELTGFLKSRLNSASFHAEPIRPYRKSPGQGELLCQFSSTEAPEIIRAVLADKWESDVADIRWSRIHAPHTVFIWFTSDCETNL